MTRKKWVQTARSIAFVIVGTMCITCGDSGGNLRSNGDGGAGEEGDTADDKNNGTDDGTTNGDTDNPNNTTGDAGSNPDICDEQNIEMELKGVKVMFVVDGSSSMSGDKWSEATSAIEKMVTDPDNADTMFGLHVLPSQHSIVCPTAGAPQIQVGPDTNKAIINWMDGNSPGALINYTTLISTLDYYVTAEDSPLRDEDTANYIVVITDGADGCFGVKEADINVTTSDKVNMLAGITDDLKDISGIKTIAIGFGDLRDEEQRQLDAIAENGGSSFNRYISASNGTQLEAALKDISESIRPCLYTLKSPNASADALKVNFLLDNNAVVRDRTHTNGWDWTKNDELEVQFYGAACETIKDTATSEVRATFGCPTKVGDDSETCANYDMFLRFPDVAVMILQDYSGSMNNDDKWENATLAITKMLNDDRNNHVEFGFNPFPNDGNGCDDIKDDPEIAVGGGAENRLKIVEWISGNDPSLLASTPLLNALDKLNTRPGRLKDDDVSGVVIVISDGEDSCSNSSNVIGRLETATKELVQNHDLRVFAVGFGAGVDRDQLDAIAINGNTGLNQFQKADNYSELDEVLGQISTMVTSCVLEVPYPGSHVDYDLTNFFFDGIAVPRDTSQQSGWDWVNAVTKKEIEFYGQYCDQLQKGVILDVVIEFGCTTLIV